jgi:hypothetical protein
METRQKIYLFFSILIVVCGITVLVLKAKKKENFNTCLCSSRNGTDRYCQNVDKVDRDYVDGKATEFSVFKNPGWTKVSSGELNYPECHGCFKYGPDGTAGDWDFSDFAK